MRIRPIDDGYRVWAPAKLNLYLEVLGDRPDGYHEIESIFHAVAGEESDASGLRDEIDVRRGPKGVTFSCDDPSLPSGKDNLAHRAAQAVIDRAGAHAGLRVELRKRIPAGSGLGGGSSDAAAVLVAGSLALGLDPSPAALLECAASIGSDVPFFLHGGTALVRGRGDVVAPLEVRRSLCFVILTPAQFVSTKAVYDALPALTRSPGGHRMLVEALFKGSTRELGDRFFNRLETVIHDLFPHLHSLQSLVQSVAPAPVRITGSGSGLYFVSGDRKEALGFLERMSGFGSGLGRAWIAISEPSEMPLGPEHREEENRHGNHRSPDQIDGES